MSTIHVREAHSKTPSEVKANLTQFEEMFTKYRVNIDWSGNRAELSGPVNGFIEIHPAEIEIQIKLGMLAKMAGIDATRLEGSIRKRIRAAL
jgi:putative polyhydroxyalkanoate system protein